MHLGYLPSPERVMTAVKNYSARIVCIKELYVNMRLQISVILWYI
jgi:hypothetical protein